MDYRYDFSDFDQQNKKKIIFIVIFSIFLIMFVTFFFRNSGNKVVRTIATIVSKPIAIVYDSTTSIFGKVSNKMVDVDKIAAENEALKNENEELKLRVLESQKVIDENTTLKQMIGIKKEYQHFEVVMGKIIYREHDNWTQTFTIDVGTNDGIEIKQAVVHENGLVGYISSVTEDTAVVITILDASSSVSVNISTVNEPAVLTGELEIKSKNRMKLMYIPLDIEISIADMLYTSGISAMYPSSIPVGRITEIVNSKNDVNRYAIVEPCVNISKISEVAVVIK